MLMKKKMTCPSDVLSIKKLKGHLDTLVDLHKFVNDGLYEKECEEYDSLMVCRASVVERLGRE